MKRSQISFIFIALLGFTSCSSTPEVGEVADTTRIDPKYSVAQDRSEFEKLRADIPSDMRRVNDEKALIAELTAEVKLAPEQARALLPQSMCTEFYMTGTLHRWAQWLSLRLESHVQEETRYIASRILDELQSQFPLWMEDYPNDSWEQSYIKP